MLIQSLNHNAGNSKKEKKNRERSRKSQKMNYVVSIILFKLSHHRLYNKSAIIFFPMAFSPQEQFALLSSILFLDFQSRRKINAKLKKKKKKNYQNPLPGTYIGKCPKTETLTIPKHIGTIIYEANPDVSFHPYNFCEPQALYYKLPLHLVVS